MKLTFVEKLSSADRKRGLNLPKHMSMELAELLGVMSGDGYIGEYKNSQGYTGRRIEIYGHSEYDKPYLCIHVAALFKKLFGLDVKIRYRSEQRTMSLSVDSPGLFFFLKSIGMNTGPKTKILIPNVILSNKRFLVPFIRGFFDTDGCVVLKKRHKNCHYYPTISLCQKSAGMIKQVVSTLEDMGFHVYVNYGFLVDLGMGKRYYSNKLEINGKDALEKWMDLIGFSNPKHLSKVSKCLDMYRNGMVKDYTKHK